MAWVRKVITSMLNRQGRNDVNDNFSGIESELTGISTNVSNANATAAAASSKADTAIATANQANTKADETQNQLDTIIIESGTSDAEVIQARGEFEILNDRLNAADTQLSDKASKTETDLILNQTDFVDFIKNHSPKYDKMYLVRTATNTYEVRLNNDQKGIVYRFVKDTNDDYIKLDACGVGLNSTATTRFNPVAGDTSNPIFANGTFVASGNNFYTVTPGDYVEEEFTGAEFTVRSLGETRGGLWNYDINNGQITGSFSCYRSSTIGLLLTLATGLDPSATHTFKLTFVGNDPANPPSSSPSRGYLTRINSTTEGMIVGGTKTGAMTTVILADASNKEFAFAVTKSGQNNWIPDHNSIGSTFNLSAPTTTINGVTTLLSDLVIGKLYPITRFELTQKMRGEVVGVADVMHLNSKHSVSIDGKLSFAGDFKALTDFTVTGYPMMLVSLAANLKTFLSSFDTVKVSSGNESNNYFTTEKDNAYSGIVVDAINKNLCGAATMKNEGRTYRKGRTGKPDLDQSLFLWERANRPKVYWQPFLSTPFVAGDAYSWAFDMIVADIENIYDMATN